MKISAEKALLFLTIFRANDYFTSHISIPFFNSITPQPRYSSQYI